MPGLTIVIAEADPQRFRSALEIGAANCALGERTRIFLQGEAARLLDAAELRSAAASNGQPGLAELIEEAIALGLHLIACQSGLALAGLSAGALPPNVETSGLIELLSTMAGDQLVIA
jgi:predicted peroxiredoxin